MGKPAFDPSKSFSPVSVAEARVVGEKPPFDPSADFAPVAEKATMSMTDAAETKGAEGLTLGLAPVAAGVGAAAGNFMGQPSGKPTDWSAVKDAFTEGRKGRIDLQKQAQEEHPYVSRAANIAGSIPSMLVAPAAKGLSGAVKLGAGLGAAQAAGSAESLEDAATDVVGGGALGGAGYGVAKGIGALAKTDAAKSVGKTLLKVPSELTGIPDKEIEAYATRADKVNKVYSDSGGDPSLAAKHLKENVLNDVQRTRQNLNNQISTALQSAPQEASLDANPILKKLEEARDKMHPVYGSNDAKAIDGLIEKVKLAAPNGKLSVQDMQATKNYLYDSAKNSYDSNGNIFPVGKEVAKAAKGAGAVAKEFMDKYGPTEIKNANRQLSQLHEIEDHMGNNLLNPNATSHSDIYAVGGGVKNNNSDALRDLGQMTGQDYLQGATDLSSARTFGKAPLLPSIKTGRSLVGPVVMGSLGGGVGALIGGPPLAYLGAKLGAGAGAIMSSPAALKLAVDIARGSGATVEQVLNSPQGQQLILRQLLPNLNQKSEPTSEGPNRTLSSIIRPIDKLKGR